jgi:DNA topoisomerase IA
MGQALALGAAADDSGSVEISGSRQCRPAAQFKIIKKLFCDPGTSSIICATDASREGEHIFRLICTLTGAKKPVERLWISLLTAQAIGDGFKKLKPSKEFDSLVASLRQSSLVRNDDARSECD